MKKHLIRILTVLCMVCLGAALFVGCKPEEEKPGPDDATTTYTVTYDANGGKGTAPATQKYEEGATFKVAQNPFTKDGETFKAWNDGSKDYAPGADYTMPKKNVTFKAQWTKTTEPPKEQVTVTFSLGEYTEGNTPAAQKVDKGEEYTLPAAPAWAGHYCTGWKVGSGDVKKVGEKITPDADVTLTAQWKEVSHAITGVTLEKTTDTMYLVVSGTYTGYTADEMVDALENSDEKVLKISICLGVKPWTYQELDIEADAEDGTWTFKFDITDLENGVYSPCENRSGSGDIAWNDAYAATEDLGGHTFEVKKRVETSGNFIQLAVTDTPDSTKVYEITGITLTQETDKAYLTISGTYEGYSESEIKAMLEEEDANHRQYFYFYADGIGHETAASYVVTATGGNWTVKMDVTELPYNQLRNICCKGVEGGDLKAASYPDIFTDTTITVGGKTYHLCINGYQNIGLTITEFTTNTYSVNAAKVEVKDGKVILTVSGVYDGFTPEEVKTKFATFGLWGGGWAEITATITAADGSFAVEIDVTDLAIKSYSVCENDGGVGDIKTVTCNSSVELNDKTYTISGTNGSNLTLTVAAKTTEPPVAKSFTVTGGTIAVEGEKAVITLSGTFAGYTKEEFKAAIEDTNENEVGFRVIRAGGDWAKIAGVSSCTVEESTFSVKLDVTAADIGSYYVNRQAGSDTAIGNVTFEGVTVSVGSKDYKLVGTGSNIELYVTAPAPTYTFSEPTSVTLEVIKSDGREEGKLFRTEVDAAFLVLKGTYTGEATEANAQEYFSQAKYSFKFTAKEWKDRLRRISIDTSAKTWTVKFDVTSLPVGDNKCVLKDADLKLTVGADATKTVKSLGSTFTLTNLESGVLAVNVKHNYAITGVDLEKDESGTPRLVMKGTYEANVWTGEDIKKFLLDDDVRTLCLNLGTYVWPMNDYYSAEVTATDGNFTVKLDISRLSARTDDLVLSEGSGYGDIVMAGISKEISTDFKKYTLKSGEGNKVVLTVALLVEQTWTVTEANVAAESDKVYITVNGTHSGYTVDEFKSLLEDSNHNDLAFRVFLFGGDWATQDTPPVYTVAAGTFSVKFDITSLPNGTFGIGKDWSSAGDIKTTSGTSTAKLAGKVYTLTGNADNLTVKIEAEIKGTITLTNATLTADTSKVYLTLSGTYEGYTNGDDVKTALETKDESGRNYFYFWGAAAKLEEAASIEVTAADGAWSYKMDVTALKVEPTRNICHNDVDQKIAAVTQETSVTLAGKVYTLQPANSWGNTGLAVADAPVEKTFTPTELKLEMSEDGTKAYVVLTATAAGYSQEELATLLYVDGDKSIAAASATLAEGVATVKFDFTNAQVAWWWPHYKFGADGQQVDIRVQVKQQSVCVNGKQIVLFYHSDNAMPSIEVLEASLAFLNAKFVQESDKLYLVLTAYNAANYTEAELKTLTYVGELETMKLTDPSVTIEGKNVTFKFDVSTLTNNGKWWWGHYTINGGDQVDLKGGFESGEVTFNGKKYSLFNNNGPQIIFDVKNA